MSRIANSSLLSLSVSAFTAGFLSIFLIICSCVIILFAIVVCGDNTIARPTNRDEATTALDKLHIDTDSPDTLAHNAALVIWSEKMSPEESLHNNSLKLNEQSPSTLNPEMQWLRDQLLEGAASELGEPFSKEYFRKLINRRKQHGEHSY